jgi:hypothetical protein
MPEHAQTFAANHQAWAKPFARRCLEWNKELAKLGLARVRDDQGRIYLLEWAGAVIDPAAGPSPAGLAKAPSGPSQPTLVAYREYIEALIASLA